MRRITGCLLLLAAMNAMGQNLVPNGDFEQVRNKYLPTTWLVDSQNLNDYVYDWYTPTGTSTDLHHMSQVPCWTCMPQTGEGRILPRSGSVTAGIINYTANGGCSPRPWHEYLGVELISPMQPGGEYCIEIWVALSCSSTYATNNIGVLFSTAPIKQDGCEPLIANPQINHTSVIDKRGQWVLIRASLHADSAWTHATIGNFFEDTATVIVPMDTFGFTGSAVRNEYSYYFIDDIYIGLCPMADNQQNDEGEQEQQSHSSVKRKTLLFQAASEVHLGGDAFSLKQLITNIGGQQW